MADSDVFGFPPVFIIPVGFAVACSRDEPHQKFSPATIMAQTVGGTDFGSRVNDKIRFTLRSHFDTNLNFLTIPSVEIPSLPTICPHRYPQPSISVAELIP